MFRSENQGILPLLANAAPLRGTGNCLLVVCFVVVIVV